MSFESFGVTPAKEKQPDSERSGVRRRENLDMGRTEPADRSQELRTQQQTDAAESARREQEIQENIRFAPYYTQFQEYTTAQSRDAWQMTQALKRSLAERPVTQYEYGAFIQQMRGVLQNLETLQANSLRQGGPNTETMKSLRERNYLNIVSVQNAMREVEAKYQEQASARQEGVGRNWSLPSEPERQAMKTQEVVRQNPPVEAKKWMDSAAMLRQEQDKQKQGGIRGWFKKWFS